ncbi:hypothetical protein PED39_03065 [Methanomassiliicoccales archaeon LGM-RCC1]|nr:hypothetical protein PED39_03065 [Methanomassiliicoccales archaeon LGM-RCC1]
MVYLDQNPLSTLTIYVGSTGPYYGQGQSFGIGLSAPLTAGESYLIVATASGYSASCVLTGAVTYSVTVNQPTVGGTITATPTSGSSGTTVTLGYSPTDGYRLVNYTVNGVTQTSNTFSLTTDTTVSATFEAIPEYTVNITTSGSGSVTTNSVTVREGAAISTSGNVLTVGSTTVTATPASGYNFSGWTGVSSSTVTQNMDVVATFNSLPTYTVTISAGTGGSVSSQSVTVVSGTSISANGNVLTVGTTDVTATAATDYTFSNWSGVGSSTVTANMSVQANFTYSPQPASYTVNVNASPAIGGSVTGSGTYAVNASATLTATPASGYQFVSWNDGNTSATRTVTVIGNVTYTATFQQITSNYTITYYVNGTQVHQDTYGAGDTVTVYQYTAPSGTTFSGWDVSIPSVMPAHNIVVNGTTSANVYSITYNLSGGSWATGYSAPTGYTSGTGLTLPTAGNLQPYQRTGYTVSFGGWYLSSDPSRTIVTSILPSETGNKSYVATWTEIIGQYPYTVNYVSTDGTQLRDPYTSTATYGTTVTPEIPSITGYTSPSSVQTITIGAASNVVTYVYEIIHIPISIYVTGEGDVYGPNTIDYGHSATYRIMAEEDYILSEVLVDGQSLGKTAIIELTDVVSTHSITVLLEYKRGAVTVTDSEGSIIESYTDDVQSTDVDVVSKFNTDGTSSSSASVSDDSGATATVSVSKSKDGTSTTETIATFVGSSGDTVTLAEINAAKNMAATAAEAIDAEANDKVHIVIDATTEEGDSDGATVNLEGISDDNTITITLIGDAGTITFDNEVIQTTAQTASTIQIVFEVDDTVNQKQIEAADGNTIYDIYAVVNNNVMTTFQGEVTISIPWELQPGESGSQVKIYFVNQDGNVELVGGVWSDGYVSATLKHFSNYFAASSFQGLKTVTVSIEGEGSVELSTEACSPGTTVTLYPTMKDGYKVTWQSSQVKVSSDNTFVMPDSDVSIKAVFEEDKGSDSGFPWWIIVLVIIAIAAIAGYVYYSRNRSR